MGVLRSSISLLVFLLCHHVQAVLLYVASYDGNITTLSLTQTSAASANPSFFEGGYFAGYAPTKNYNLTVLSSFNTSTQSPSWLTLNSQNNVLYLADEAVTSGNGTLVSYRTSPQDAPVELERVSTISGGVYATFYANGNSLAVPHYSTSTLTTYNVTADGQITPLQSFTYNMSAPGPVADRQDAPHPHETILDPTGQYVLIPDLGADLVRVYSAAADGTLSESTPLTAAPGSGPRHGAFSRDMIPASDGTQSYLFYLAAEISATVTAYRVTYADDGLQFDELPNGNLSSLAPGAPVPPTTTGESTGVTAEIALSPDGNFVIVSNRRDETFQGGDAYPPNGTSDSLSSFRVRPDLSGALDFAQAVPAGGAYPRQFAINKAGNLVAVGLQESSKVAILERDVESGWFKRQVAEADVAGQLTCVVWDE